MHEIGISPNNINSTLIIYIVGIDQIDQKKNKGKVRDNVIKPTKKKTLTLGPQWRPSGI